MTTNWQNYNEIEFGIGIGLLLKYDIFLSDTIEPKNNVSTKLQYLNVQLKVTNVLFFALSKERGTTKFPVKK